MWKRGSTPEAVLIAGLDRQAVGQRPRTRLEVTDTALAALRTSAV
jgi:hypothetical protein